MADNIMGSQIRSLRLERAWSQEQLADIAGLSVRTIQRLEQGQGASLESLKALASSFQVPLSFFSKSQQPAEAECPPQMAAPQMSAPVADWRGFRRTLLVYAVVNGCLAAFNLIKNPDHLWFVYVLGGWGLALVLKAIRLKWPN